jgi:uroporphyrinogen-III synthase
VVYRTVPGPGIPDIVAGVRESAVDALLFASASAVRFVADALVADASGARLRPAWPVAVCLGSVTADAAREAGFQSVVVANETTQNELIYRVALWFGRPEREGLA